nr:hypothetical protein [Tanacetum cinerariifolium]
FCIATKSHQCVSETVQAEIHEDDNDTEMVVDHMDDNSVKELKDILNELKANKKENDEILETSKDEVDKPNTEYVIASHSLPSKATKSNDLSCPYGFEHLRMVSLVQVDVQLPLQDFERKILRASPLFTKRRD